MLAHLLQNLFIPFEFSVEFILLDISLPLDQYYDIFNHSSTN